MLRLVERHEDKRSIGAIAFSSDGSRFATGGAYRDHSIRVWDRRTLTRIATLRGHKKRITGLAFAQEASTLVSSGADGKVALWNVERAERLASHDAHTKAVNDVACAGPFGMEPRAVASGGQEGAVCMWRPDSETRPRTMAAHQGSANAVALSPRGDLLVTAGGVERGNFSILVWDIATGRPVRALAGHSDWPLWVAFSRDANLLASGSYGEICLWDARSLQLSRTLRRPDTLRFSTVAFSFTSDPCTFVSGGWAHDEQSVEVRDASGAVRGWNVTRKGLVQLWDLTTGRLRDCVPAHDDGLTCLAASPTEGLLITGAKDGAKMWELAPGRR